MIGKRADEVLALGEPVIRGAVVSKFTGFAVGVAAFGTLLCRVRELHGVGVLYLLPPVPPVVTSVRLVPPDGDWGRENARGERELGTSSSVNK